MRRLAWEGIRGRIGLGILPLWPQEYRATQDGRHLVQPPLRKVRIAIATTQPGRKGTLSEAMLSTVSQTLVRPTQQSFLPSLLVNGFHSWLPQRALASTCSKTASWLDGFPAARVQFSRLRTVRICTASWEAHGTFEHARQPYLPSDLHQLTLCRLAAGHGLRSDRRLCSTALRPRCDGRAARGSASLPFASRYP